jgi:hypothetical protein
LRGQPSHFRRNAASITRSTRPYRIGIFVTCVTNQGSTYSATFGYENEDTESNTIPVAAEHILSAAGDRNQTRRSSRETYPGLHGQRHRRGNTTPLEPHIRADRDTPRRARTFPDQCSTPPDFVPIGLFVPA